MVRRIFAMLVVYGMMALGLLAQTFSSLFSFNGTDGSMPDGNLVQGIDGNLYGATQDGGTYGYGTVFSISPSGAFTELYSFCTNPPLCTDGEFPFGGLVQAADGNFYGTAAKGGNSYNGTIFRITPSGMLTTVYLFCSQSGCTDGSLPYAGLVLAPNGDFYGTTASGGVYYGGTVYQLMPNGKLKTLYSFCYLGACPDGSGPGALVLASNGDLYGETGAGGAANFGTIFKITPSGALTTLHSFCSQSGCTDGYQPAGAMIQGSNGDLYGTTDVGGTGVGGAIFKITPTGTFTSVYSFCIHKGCPDGKYPQGLVQGTDGNIYGTTLRGGAYQFGTFFKITPGGSLTTIYSFCAQGAPCPDGAQAYGPLLLDTNGIFYGTMLFGGNSSCGSFGCGTMFSLATGLGPFVKPQPTSGKVGAAVELLGTNLTGVTSVAFNGTPASFSVDSASLITTTVPAGATTGKIEVTTPSDTLSSNVAFRVLP